MTDTKRVRLFAGPDGETHFEDVAVEFTSNPASAIPRSEMSEWLLAERVRFQSFPPGRERVAHLNANISFTWQAQLRCRRATVRCATSRKETLN
jgi:hypothetical protein